MKFAEGHWVMRRGVRAAYAADAYETRVESERLTIIAATQILKNRGMTIGGPTITLRISSPLAGVLCFEAAHFLGAKAAKPEFALHCERPQVCVREDGFQSAHIAASIGRNMQIAIASGGERITGMGFRSLGVMDDENTGKRYLSAQLDLDVGECIYGLGERFTPFVKNGQSVDMWQGDGGSCSELAYKNVPFYLSSKGYGVFVDSPADVSFEVGSENVERVRFSAEGESLRFYVIAGAGANPLKDALSRYTHLTGRPALPPAWSFGLWLTTSFTTDYDEATVMHFLRGMQERDIPLSVFHFDCFWMKGWHWCDFAWDEAMFPDPEGMLRRLKARGLHICVWINPYIAQHSRLFEEAKREHYLIEKTDGSVWQSDLWQPGMGVVDFTNPAACAWYKGHLLRLVGMGVDCFKTDFGERIPVKDVAYFDGGDPVRMHNYYAQLYNQLVFETLEEARGRGEAVVFARSATAGGQKYPCHWGGDNFATYVSMAETLRGGLSLAMCGFGFWSHDISGFEDTAPAHVYKRWCAFGLLSTHSRLHGSSSYRVPWLFDEEAVDVLRHFARLKCRLMPYLFAMSVAAHETGVPVLRPMVLEFPADPACRALDRQYMLGDSLLVAPVMREDGVVEYYLPEGRWTHLLDGRVQEGGHWLRESYDFFSLPLWVRENTLLPWGGHDDRPDYDYLDGLAVRPFFVQPGAAFTVYDASGRPAAQIRAAHHNGAAAIECDHDIIILEGE